jgi:serine/threonine protein kinase
MAKFCAACGTSLGKSLKQLALLQDRYEIIGPLGQGGMSDIYLAKDIWQQGRHIVVKKLDTDLLLQSEREEAISLFRKEVEILTGLNHVNLPVILDHFSLGHREYIVMEYVGGRNLAQILDDNPEPLPEKQVIAWAKQLCEVLSYLHSQEPPIIHRNVKPSNIMLSNDNTIKLMDFGIARTFKPGKKRDTVILGTPGYSPPEQYGRGQTDPRSDIYSLGITIYVLLTKYDPEKSEFNLPSLRSLNPTVSPQTEASIHTAIQYRPQARFQSVAEMWDALVTGNLEFIERHPSWYIWQREIRQSLMETGETEAVELTSVLDHLRPIVIKRYVELHSEQDISCSSDFHKVWVNRFQDWQALNRKWKNARDSFGQLGSHSKEAIEEVVGEMQKLLSLQKMGEGIDCGRLSVYHWNLEPILSDIRVAPILPLIALHRITLLESDLEDLRNVLDPAAKGISRIAFLLLFSDGLDLQNDRRLLRTKMRQVYAYDVISLAHEELFQIATAKEMQRVFRNLILSQVDLTAISPFIITGPTSEYNFFGREQEMQTIVEQAASASFTVIGGRRIGKSSLLGRLHKVRLPAAGFCALYYDCSNTLTYETFLAASIEDWQPEAPPHTPATFGDLLQTPPKGKPLVLLLDEADKLIPTDRTQGWRLFNTLRAFANSGRGQVVLSGERTLREALRDPQSPLFNFVNEMILGPLDFRAVEELVTRPMKQLEIELVEEAQIVKRIWDFTSGHPNIVQRLCSRLIERLNVQGTRRITLDEVDAVINDPGFQEEDFLQTYWERATPLERIISLLMAQDTKPCRLQDVLNLLAAEDLQPEPEVVKAALDRLVDLRSILKRSQVGYEFAVTAFPLVLANTTTAEDLLIVLKSQYHKNPLEVAE